MNINGALNLKGFDLTFTQDETINSESTIELFKNIESKYQQASQIFIICDNARYYKSKMVSSFLENSKIKLVFLPSYSPNLNLIERLWRFFHKKVTANKYYEKFREFEQATLHFFNSLHLYHHELKTLLVENFQVLGRSFSQIRTA